MGVTIQPLVSVIINCFNGEKYLHEAIDSVFEQTYINWEIIFWDNQSTDESAKIFYNYKDNRLKYFYAPNHTVLYEARNLAIAQAKGEYFAFLDVDDWWLPDKLEKQIPLFNDLEVGMVYGKYFEINDTTKITNLRYRREMPVGWITNELLKSYVVGLLTIVFRKSTFEKIGNFNKRYMIIGDLDATIRMSIISRIDCVQAPIAYYRVHNDNYSLNYSTEYQHEIENWINTNERAMHSYNIKALLDYHRYYKVHELVRQHEYIKAIRLISSIDQYILKLKAIYTIIKNII
jgi:glycosyltransferase involved in cell wall biosynthesis